MDDVFPLYEELWRRAQGEGAIVRYEERDEDKRYGWFDSSRNPPHIIVVRPYYEIPGNRPTRTRRSDAPPDLAPPDIHDELITLAHEYGHFRSRAERAEYKLYDRSRERRYEVTNEARKKGDQLRDALRTELTDDDRARIIREETYAWEIGRKVLADLEFDDFARYDKRERKGLQIHRYRLGIDDARSEDV